MTTFSRRTFLRAAALLGTAPCLRAIEPIVRQAPPRLRLSLAAYSFRDFFRDRFDGSSPRPPAGGHQLDIKAFIDFCAEHGCDGAELTSYYFPKELTESMLIDLRRHAFVRGVSISGTAVGNTFTVPAGEKRDREISQVKQWIERARIMGAPHIRVFAGNAEGQSLPEARRLCISALEECGEIAGRAGIFLGLENHGGIVSDAVGVLEILRAVRSPWVGLNLDTGNFHSADPYAELVQCAPYAVNVQFKVEIQRGNARPEPADFPRVIKILRDSGYEGWVALEYEAAEDPFAAVPRHLKALGALFRESA